MRVETTNLSIVISLGVTLFSSDCYMKRRSSISTDSQCSRLFVYFTFHFFTRFVVARRRSLSKAKATQRKCRSHCFSSVIFNDRYIIHSLQKSQFIRFQVWNKSLFSPSPFSYFCVFPLSYNRVPVWWLNSIPFHHRNLDPIDWFIQIWMDNWIWFVFEAWPSLQDSNQYMYSIELYKESCTMLFGFMEQQED